MLYKCGIRPRCLISLADELLFATCLGVVLTALCVVMATYAATARTTYDALTVVDICLYIVTLTLVSSATRVSRNSLIRVPVPEIL